MRMRTVFTSLCAAAMTVGSLALGVAPASATIINTPGYFHIENIGSHKCIDAGSPAVQWRCLNTGMEEWQFVPLPGGTHGEIEIFNQATGQCLAQDWQKGDGDPITLEPCTFVTGHLHFFTLWRIINQQEDSRGMYSQLYNIGNDRCLDLENGDASDGVPMQAWSCNNNTDNQHWRVF